MSADRPAAESHRLTAKGQATRDRIVTAAAGLMYQRGVAGTSTDDVQAAAGVSPSQLYHYFRDKRTLVRAVIAFQADSVLDVQEPLLSRLDSVDALRAWRDFLVDRQRRYGSGGCPIGSLGNELAEADADARAEVANGFRRWEAAIRTGLATMRDRGDLRRDADPDALALAMLAAVEGGLLLAKIRRDPRPLAVALDAMINHVACLTTAHG